MPSQYEFEMSKPKVLRCDCCGGLWSVRRTRFVDRDADAFEVPSGGDLLKLLTKTWSKAEFEEYAVARGFL